MPCPPSSSDGTLATRISPPSRSSSPASRMRPDRRRGSTRRRPSCRTRRGRTAGRRRSPPTTGRRDHVARSPTGTTSTCPTSTIRRPPGRPSRPRTIGSRSRGISSPGQSGSSRDRGRVRLDPLDPTADLGEQRRHAVLHRALVAGDARDPDDVGQGIDRPSRPRPRRRLVPLRRAGSRALVSRLRHRPRIRGRHKAEGRPSYAREELRREQVNARLRGLAERVQGRPVVKWVVPVLAVALVATVLVTNPPARPTSTSAPGSPIAGASPDDRPGRQRRPDPDRPSRGRTSSSARSRSSPRSPRTGRTAPGVATPSGVHPPEPRRHPRSRAGEGRRGPARRSSSGSVPARAQDEVILEPAEPLLEDTTYRLPLTARGRRPRRARGRSARSAPLHIVHTIPGDEETDVPVDTGIEVTFDQDGSIGLADHFSIEPAVAGPVRAARPDLGIRSRPAASSTRLRTG